MADTMSTFTLHSRPALADCAFGRFGAAGATGIVLTALPEGHLLHLLARPEAGDLAVSLTAALAPYGSVLRKTGPGQWFAGGDRALSPDDLAAVASAVGADVAVSDQSHGRVRIGLDGQDSVRLLAKSVAVDLHPDRFPVGHSATMFSSHTTINLIRLSATAFEITVLRGFAADLFEAMRHQAYEFGVETRKA